MFSTKDATVYNLANSFDKLDQLGNTYFPQLGGLLLKANELIYTIYGIQPFQHYKISQTPTNNQGRREGVIFVAKKNEANQVIVGLRGKGKPSQLFRPNGAPCQMHFANLGFCIGNPGDDSTLLVGFEPYVLKYNQQHHNNFAALVEHLALEANLQACDIGYNFSHDQPTLSTLLRQHKVIIASEQVQGINPSMVDLAQLVVMYAAMFPLLDVFTRLSNGENTQNTDYTSKFQQWLSTKGQVYIDSFHAEPIKEDTSRVSEAFVRSQFESLLNVKFPTVRPTWLKAKKTGSSLELDGYCEPLRLAFEYQGEYHYFYVPVHHKERSLEDVQKTDVLKANICKQHNVSLIQVPYWKKGDLSYILQALHELGRHDITLRLNQAI